MRRYPRGVDELPAAARSIATATTAAVLAARNGDPEGYGTAADALAALDPGQVGLVLGAVVRMLLEERHPDGLDSDDIRAVLAGCARSALAWYPELDVNALAVLLVGALGVHPEPGEAPDPAEGAVARHAPVLVADLLGGAALAPYLTAAFTDLAQTQAMELP